VKAFSEAKLRLSPALGSADRAALAREMANHVVTSAAPLPVAVVCDDADVAAWARDVGALVVWEPERGLNRAVEAGVARLAADGARQVVVAHADLPHAASGHLGRLEDHHRQPGPGQGDGRRQPVRTGPHHYGVHVEHAYSLRSTLANNGGPRPSRGCHPPGRRWG